MKQVTIDQLTDALGWTLLHSIWQTAIIALGLFIVINFSQKLSPNVKYVIGVVALLFAGLLSTLTFLDLYFHHQPSIEALQESIYTENEFSEISQHISNDSESLLFTEEKNDWHFTSLITIAKVQISKYLNWIVGAWLVGVLLFSLKFAGSLIYIQRLKQNWVTPVAQEWQLKVQEIAKLLEIRENIQMLSSQMANVPMLIGHFKPVILIPVTMLTGLPQDQLEAIIAHEIAHIYRNDYWVNILQSCFEIIFFFHPAIWWINQLIRDEREKCCDDLAVAICGNSLVYVKALASVEEAKLKQSSLALAINGGKSSLLQRIERLVEPGKKGSNPIARFVSASLIIAVILLLSTSGDSVAYRYGKDKFSEALAWTPFLKFDHDTSIQLNLNKEINLDLDLDLDPDIDVEIENEEQVEISNEIETDVDIDLDIPANKHDTIPPSQINHLLTSPIIITNLASPKSTAKIIQIADLPDAPDSVISFAYNILDTSPQVIKISNASNRIYVNTVPADTGIHQFHFNELSDVMRLNESFGPALASLDSVLSKITFQFDQQHFADMIQDTTLAKRLKELESTLSVKEDELEELLREKEVILQEYLKKHEIEFKKHEEAFSEEMREQEQLMEEQMRKHELQLKQQEDQLRKQMEQEEKKMKEQEAVLKMQESDFDKANSALESELKKDGLINSGEKYTYKITDDALYLNNEKLSEKYYQKYSNWMKENDFFQYEEGSTFSITRIAK